MTGKTAMNAAPRILFLVMIAFFSEATSAIEISYDLKSTEPVSYRLTSSSLLDFGRYETLAGALGIRRIGQNALVECRFENQKRLDKGSGLFRGEIERVSIVNIFNDSLYVVDSPGWDIFRAGNTGDFSLSRNGRITGIGSNSNSNSKEQNLLALWKFILPEFPSSMNAKDVSWEREIALTVESNGPEPLPVTLKITYNYSESKNRKTKEGTFFEYIVTGFSPISADFRVSGSGEMVFDKVRGRMMTNVCKLKITGFGGLGDFGLPADLAGKIPLTIDTEINIKQIGQ